MEQVKHITSTNNEKIKYFINLKDKAFRKETQKFLIEGYHLVEEAKKAQVLEAIITSDEKIVNVFSDFNVYFVNDAIIKKLSSTKTPQPIIGVVKMLNHSTTKLYTILKKEKVKLVLLDEINDPGNLGTIIRTVAGLGYDAIGMNNECVDIYNEKVIRSTQGALFKIPIIRGDLLSIIGELKKAQVKCLGTALNGANELEKVQKIDRFAICVGNEARGISKDVLQVMDDNIKITMHNDVESLNVAIALAILMYKLK